jgi:Tol biopolymer transport system component
VLKATDAALPFAPGIVSTRLNERDLAVSPDGSEIMYTLGTLDNALRSIVLIKLKDGMVSSKEIAPFSGRYNDIEPFFSPDGKKVYFSSSRPLHDKDSSTDFNIWYAEKINGAWQPNPKPVSDVINSDADEFYPAVTANGNIYFTAAYTSGFGREDIFWSALIDGRYGAPYALDTVINSSKYEFNAYVSPNEDILIFSSYGRPDDLGGGDLYLSVKDLSGRWSLARHLGGGINSSTLDYCPFLDLNTSTFYFTSNRAAPITGKVSPEDFHTMADDILNGMGNIFSIRLDKLGLKP